MASKRLLVLVVLFFYLSSCLVITGQDLSKHVVKEKGSKIRGPLIGDAKPNKSSTRSTRGSPIKAESDGYTHVAGYQSKGADGVARWHGVRAKISVWKIQDVQPLSESSAYIAAISNWDGLEYVTAGVHVYPRMYNNSDLRFFTYWKTTKDGTIKGCYNNYCPGFVIANGSNLLPGQGLAPLSNYGGETRYITIRIKKDEKTGDWSLYREDQGGPIGGMTLLGWWPQSLFKSLSDRANVIQWTGEVNYQYNETGPSMGSGHFSDEHEGKAAIFSEVYGFDGFGSIYNNYYNPIPFVDKSECYNISPWYGSVVDKPKRSHHFFYGGPSGCSH